MDPFSTCEPEATAGFGVPFGSQRSRLPPQSPRLLHSTGISRKWPHVPETQCLTLWTSDAVAVWKNLSLKELSVSFKKRAEESAFGPGLALLHLWLGLCSPFRGWTS